MGIGVTLRGRRVIAAVDLDDEPRPRETAQSDASSQSRKLASSSIDELRDRRRMGAWKGSCRLGIALVPLAACVHQWAAVDGAKWRASHEFQCPSEEIVVVPREDLSPITNRTLQLSPGILRTILWPDGLRARTPTSRHDHRTGAAAMSVATRCGSGRTARAKRAQVGLQKPPAALVQEAESNEPFCAPARSQVARQTSPGSPIGART